MTIPVSGRDCERRASVMVARGAIGNPFLFAEIRAALEGRDYEPPSVEEVVRVLLDHMEREMLTGRPPFTAKKAIQVIRKVLKEDPVPCRQVFAQDDWTVVRALFEGYRDQHRHTRVVRPGRERAA